MLDLVCLIMKMYVFSTQMVALAPVALAPVSSLI